jgi:rare lipoprotein A
MKPAFRLAATFLFLGALGCAGKPAPTTLPAPVGYTERGTASWYGAKFHGRTTASGERYDMHAMTAAHRTLPFGVVVEVTNLDNDRRVRVRINDRGPFKKGRIIDLSYAAARKLDMVHAGLARVKIRVVRDGASGGSTRR